MIFTALSPNTQKDDFKLAVETVFKTDEYENGSYSEKVRSWFKTFFNLGNISLFESARTGLFLLLKELGVKKGDEVLIQAFTCVAAVNPIKWAGAKPVFVDIEQGTYNIDFNELVNKVNSRTKAIIVQHTFGYPAKIEEIVEYARSKGIFVIEDCAHTIGTELDGKKLGTFGDAAVFSLGRDKAISASFGGAVITKDEKLGRKLEAQEQFLDYPDKKWIRKQLTYTIVAYITRKLYKVLGIGKLFHKLFYAFKLISKATSEKEKKSGAMPEHAKSKLPNALAKIALNQLKKIEKINKNRREIANLYTKRLQKEEIEQIKLPRWINLKNFFPLRYPLVVKDRKDLMDFAYNRGLFLGDWYEAPVAPKDVDHVAIGYKQGSCPKAERVCEGMINLPLNVDISEEKALKIVATLKNFYNT